MASHGFAQDDFNTSLFGCFHDVPSFLDGLFCPCCAVSAQYNMLKHRRTGGIPHVYLPLFILNFFTWGLALSIFSVVTRNMLRRTLFFTQETELSSCCKAFLCTTCSICQVYRELSIRHAWPDGVCVDAPYVNTDLWSHPPTLTAWASWLECSQTCCNYPQWNPSNQRLSSMATQCTLTPKRLKVLVVAHVRGCEGSELRMPSLPRPSCPFFQSFVEREHHFRGTIA